MARDTDQHFFTHKAIVEELIKRQGLHHGQWMLTVELGLKGTNVNIQTETGGSLLPAGLVIISRVGITQTTEPNDLSVDAAQVNPPPTSSKRAKHRRKKER